MTTQTKKRPVLLIVLAAIAGICVLCLAGTAAMDALGILPNTTSSPVPTSPPLPTQTPQPTVTPAQKYLDEYGGKIEVYNEILAMTDCAALQEQFDIASENNSRAEAGTEAFRWTLGYMTAADDRMKELNCYQ